MGPKLTTLCTYPSAIQAETVKWALEQEGITTFVADSKEPKIVTLPVAAAQLGTGDMAELTLEVDRTFAPGGGDVRDLGIRVFHAFIEPK